MVPSGITSYSHQVLPHYPRVSGFASLHSAHTLLFLFLFSFSTTCLLFLVVLGVSRCLRSSQERSQEYYALPMHYGLGRGHLGHGHIP